MSAEVRSIPVQHRVGFPPDPEVVKHIEDLLELAKSGKIRAVASAVVYHDGLVPDGEIGSGHCAPPGTRFALGYAISMLWYRFQKRCDEG